MSNSAYPDQLASSGSTLFAKAGHIRVHRDQVNDSDLDEMSANSAWNLDYLSVCKLEASGIGAN